MVAESTSRKSSLALNFRCSKSALHFSISSLVPFALSCAMRSAFCCALDGTRGGGGADAAVEDMPRAGVGCVPARGAPAATSLFDAADAAGAAVGCRRGALVRPGERCGKRRF